MAMMSRRWTGAFLATLLGTPILADAGPTNAQPYVSRLLPGITIVGVAQGGLWTLSNKTPCVMPGSRAAYLNNSRSRKGYIPCSAVEEIDFDGTSIRSTAPALWSVASLKARIARQGKLLWSVRPDASYEMTGVQYQGHYYTLLVSNDQYDTSLVISKAK